MEGHQISKQRDDRLSGKTFFTDTLAKLLVYQDFKTLYGLLLRNCSLYFSKKKVFRLCGQLIGLLLFSHFLSHSLKEERLRQPWWDWYLCLPSNLVFWIWCLENWSQPFKCAVWDTLHDLLRNWLSFYNHRHAASKFYLHTWKHADYSWNNFFQPSLLPFLV